MADPVSSSFGYNDPFLENWDWDIPFPPLVEEEAMEEEEAVESPEGASEIEEKEVPVLFSIESSRSTFEFKGYRKKFFLDDLKTIFHFPEQGLPFAPFPLLHFSGAIHQSVQGIAAKKFVRASFEQLLLKYYSDFLNEFKKMLKTLHEKQGRLNLQDQKNQHIITKFLNQKVCGHIYPINQAESTWSHYFIFHVSPIEMVHLVCTLEKIGLEAFQNELALYKLQIVEKGGSYVVKDFCADRMETDLTLAASTIPLAMRSKTVPQTKAVAKATHSSITTEFKDDLVAEWYEPPHFRSILKKQLLETRGRFSFNFELLQKLTLFSGISKRLSSKATFNSREKAIKEFRTFCRFFHFTADKIPDENGLQDALDIYCNKDRALVIEEQRRGIIPQLISLLVADERANGYYHLEDSYPPLDDNVAVEVTAAFFDLKWLEFTRHHKIALYPDAKLPFYLLTHDGNRAVVYPMIAIFDRDGRLGMLVKDTQGVAVEKLKQIVGDIDSSVEPFSLTLSQLEKISLEIESKMGTDTVEFIVLQRHGYAKEASKEDESQAEKIASPSSRKRKCEDGDAESEAKVCMKPEQKKQKRDHAHSGGGRERDMGLSHYYAPLSDPRVEMQRTRSTSPEIEGPTKIEKSIESVSKEIKMPGRANFFQSISYTAVKATEMKATKEEIKAKMLLDVKPLAYPILDAFKEAKLSAFACFNPLLKEYQKREVHNLIHLRSKQLSPIIASEMGLGKTFIYGEIITQRIAAWGDNGIHMVVVPKALLEQVHASLCTSFGESITYAWQKRAKNRTVEFAAIYLDELFEKKKKIFAALPSFDAAHLYQAYSQSSFGAYNVAMYLKSQSIALWAHLQNIERRLCDSPTEKQLLCREIEAIIRAHADDARYNCGQGDAFKEWQSSLRLVSYHSSVLELKKSIEELLDAEKLFKVWKRELHFSSSLFSLLALFGRLFQFHPGRANGDAFQRQDDMRLERITSFSTDRIVQVPDKDALKEALQINESVVIIASYEMLQKFDVTKLERPIHTICLDEAQRVHNETTNNHEFLKKFVMAVTEARKQAPLISLVTGTPFENSFNELWNLLSIANPKGLHDESLATLTRLYDETVQVAASAGKRLPDFELMQFAILSSFAQFFIFKFGVVDTLVSRVKMTDAQVRRDWGDKVPEKREKTINVSLDEERKAKFDELKTGTLFERNHASIRLLMHPKLLDVAYKTHNPDVYEFMNDIRSGRVPIDDSPFLRGLLKAKGFRRALEKRQPSIIIVDKIVDGNVLQIAISKDPRADVQFYHGKSKDQSAIDWFKESRSAQTTKILILSIKKGGTGFDLPEAVKVFIMTREYNPAAEVQATDRAVRVGYSGVKKIYRFDYGLFFQSHMHATHILKRSWESFLFGLEGASLEEIFSNWCQLLEDAAYKCYLNESKNLDKSQELKSIIHARLVEVKQKITLDELKDICYKVLPIALMKKFIAKFDKQNVLIEEIQKSTLPPLNLKTTVILPLAESTDLAEAILAAYAFKMCPKQQEVKEMYKSACEPSTNTSEKRIVQGQAFLTEASASYELLHVLEQCEIQIYEIKHDLLVSVAYAGKKGMATRLRLLRQNKELPHYHIVTFPAR